jgi:multisubunit Na+/H+ antiporter MnhB subunit
VEQHGTTLNVASFSGSTGNKSPVIKPKRKIPTIISFDTLNPMSQTIAVLIAGLSVGVMMGLSVSPIVGTVVSAILALIVSGVTIMAGIKHEKGEQIRSLQLWPVANMMVALLLGGCLGVYGRTARVLGESPEGAMKRWTNVPFLLPKDIVARRLFELSYPVTTGGELGDKKEQKPPSPNSNTPGFYSAPSDLGVCGDLTISSTADEVRRALANATGQYWTEISELTRGLEGDSLVKAVHALCPQEPK